MIIAFDFGTRKIGVAVGEYIIKSGKALDVINANNGNPNWNIIQNLLTYWQPTLVVVGLPLNIDGTKQQITNKSEQFAQILKHKFNIPVVMHDERLSTVEAKSRLFEKGGFKKLNKKKIHSYSAVIILESWFMNIKFNY